MLPRAVHWLLKFGFPIYYFDYFVKSPEGICQGAIQILCIIWVSVFKFASVNASFPFYNGTISSDVMTVCQAFIAQPLFLRGCVLLLLHILPYYENVFPKLCTSSQVMHIVYTECIYTYFEHFLDQKRDIAQLQEFT